MENDITNKNENLPKKTSISLPAAIVTGAVIIAIALMIVLGSKNSDSKPPKDTTNTTPPAEVKEVPADVAIVRNNDHILGDPTKAEIAIIEYSDSDCPFCIKFHPTLQTIYKDYDGKVALVYRYFPLDSLHPNASTEAVALECVAQLGGNDAFNKYLDTIINVTLSPNPKSNEALVGYAKAEGIDEDLFKKCIADPAAANRVKSNAEEAQKIGAQGTPFSIAVNLKTGAQEIIPGAYPLEYVREIIDSLLK